jgi:hypothetical protein
MREKVSILIVLLCSYGSFFGQNQNVILDSLNREYLQKKDLKEKTVLAGKLALFYLSVNPAKSDSFASLSIEHAELSRDRLYMVKAYRYNADRYASMAGKKEFLPKAISYYEQTYNLARESKLYKEMISTLLGMSALYRGIPDADKAMNYTTQAFALLSDRSMDSLESRCYLSFGSNYLMKKEKLLALRNFFNALKIAEQKKDPQLLRDCYLTLSQFYVAVENYDKAIDYVVKANGLVDDIKQNSSPYMKVRDHNFMGSLFVQKKQYDLALKSYTDAIALANKLKYDPLKLESYLSIFNMYLISNRPAEALHYFNTKPELKEYILRTGFSGVIDQAYGYIYNDLGKLDSASYHFRQALPFFRSQLGNLSKVNFFLQYANHQIKAKEYLGAITLLKEADETAKQMNDLDWQQKIARQLDSAYQFQGNYKEALGYSNRAQQLKDSLVKLGKEEEILQLQLADEEDRRARLLAEQEAIKKQRHQYQYLAITIGIAVLFVLLVMLGAFKVSSGTIRIVGFFTFLMMFEFIFLLSKKSVYTFTEGEPWKDLAFMIALAALLLPLHHWVEHKVIHYLTTSHKLKLDTSRYSVKRIFQKNKKKEPHDHLV